MRLLAVDPGAERCGWALLEPGPTLLRSGVLRCHREADEAFQPYRLRLEQKAGRFFDRILVVKCDISMNEIIPAVGGGNFAVATQSYLANCVVSVLHDCAFRRGVEVRQIAARTVQSKIGIKGRTGKVSKAGMRNGVLQHFPHLSMHVKDSDDWPWDRWDAIGIGLAALDLVTNA